MQSERNAKASGDDPVFITSTGMPLVHDAFIDGKRRLTDAIKCMFWRVQHKTGINGGRGYYCLRKTAATEIEKINPLVTGLFLGHTEKGQKRFYAERTFQMLDEATEMLASVLGAKWGERETRRSVLRRKYVADMEGATDFEVLDVKGKLAHAPSR